MKNKYIMASLSIILSIFLSILLIIGIVSIGLLSTLFMVILSISITLIISVTISAYFSKSIKFYNIGIFISFLINIILIYYIYNINSTYNYLENIYSGEYKYVTYNVYVLENNNIKSIDGKTIGILKNNKDNTEEYLKTKGNVMYKIYDNLEDISKALDNKEIESAFINEKHLEISRSDLRKKVKIMNSYQIKEYNI